MVAAQIFNEREGQPVSIIYGIVSAGTVWKFMTLAKQRVCIDNIEYYINQVNKILGIIIKPIKKLLKL